MNLRRIAVAATVAALLVIAVPLRSSWAVSQEDTEAAGSLLVKIKPQAARESGARWRVDGGRWLRSGRVISGLSVGPHEVTFKPVAGWNAPAQKVVSITADKTTTLTGKYLVPAVPPVASFTANQTGGAEPLQVQFTDLSTPGSAPITSWAWDFESDGVVDSTEQDPEHTFTGVEDFDVTLTVSSSSGSDTLTKQAYIYTIAAGPTALFSAAPSRGAPPLLVQFTDQSASGTFPISLWAWDFESDGIVDSTEQNPQHTYSTVGDYDVTLTVTSAAGPDTLTRTSYVHLAVVKPSAWFDATTTNGFPALDVQFIDQSTQGSSPITSWEWDFDGDGVVDSTEQNPQHTYPSVGKYAVSLTVSSADGIDAVTRDDFVTVDTTIDLPGNVALEMVWIPAGSFLMGRRSGENDSDPDESPQHEVTITEGFWMGKYEVTQAQWLAVMGSNPSHFTGVPTRPVESVSWESIQAFISAVNALEQGTVRLPSEAQWEYACRAGTTTRFYWGNDPDYSLLLMGNFAWYGKNSNSITHPVGQKLPNQWGLYDMSGNVWEWCEDWYHENYTGAPTDGSAWMSPTGSFRVFRGGAWGGDGAAHRSASRFYSVPYLGSDRLGFRLMRMDDTGLDLIASTNE